MKPKSNKEIDDIASVTDAPPMKSAAATLSAAQKRQQELEVKPKLNLALKLQVTKKDLKQRPFYQEVAEVFEEMLQATE